MLGIGSSTGCAARVVAALTLAALGCGGGHSSQEDASHGRHDAGADVRIRPDAAGHDVGRPQTDGQVDAEVVDPCAAVDCAACAVYVDLAAADGGDGTTPATAFRTVQAGIDAAATAAGQCCSCEVRVAAGTYYQYATSPRDALWLRERVDVLGGYPTGFAGARNVVANPTVLDGRKAAAGGGPDDEFRVYHVVVGADRMQLDGFTIEGGAATENADEFNANNYGGGLLAVDVSPTIGHCVFKANQALHGGGAFFGGGATTLENTRFEGNTAAGRGGGLDLRLGTLAVSDARFTGNTAADGAGAHVGARATLSVTGDGLGSCLFDGNTASGNGGALDSEESTVTLGGCTVSNNTAAEGGGVSSRGGGAFTAQLTKLVGNTATTGGGLLSRDDSTTTLAGDTAEGCLLENNVARETGGAVAGFGGTHSLTSCTVRGNTVHSLDQYPAVAQGAGLHFEDADVKLDTVVIINNRLVDAPSCIADGCFTAQFGGGLSVLRSTLDVTASRLESNLALVGAAAYLKETTATVAGTRVLTNVFPTQCHTYPCSGGVLAADHGSLVVTDSELKGNATNANNVYALSTEAADLTVARCRLLGNGDMALAVSGGQALVESTLIVGNGTTHSGWNWATIATWDTVLHLTNSTVVANWSFSRSADMSCGSGVTGKGLVVTNSIFWGNTRSDGEIGNPVNCPTTATYSDVQGGYPGTGNLNTDPLFVSTSGGDPTLWDLHLKGTPASPCIDSGTSTGITATTDLDGNPRLHGTKVDVGAYENQGN